MKHFVQNLILVIVLTILLLFSYAFLQKKTENFGWTEFYHFLFDRSSGQEQAAGDKAGEEQNRQITEEGSTTGRTDSVIWNLTLTAVP